MLDALKDNNFFKLLFEASPTAMIIINSDGLTQTVNPEAAKTACS